MGCTLPDGLLVNCHRAQVHRAQAVHPGTGHCMTEDTDLLATRVAVLHSTPHGKYPIHAAYKVQIYPSSGRYRFYVSLYSTGFIPGQHDTESATRATVPDGRKARATHPSLDGRHPVHKGTLSPVTATYYGAVHSLQTTSYDDVKTQTKDDARPHHHNIQEKVTVPTRLRHRGSSDWYYNTKTHENRTCKYRTTEGDHRTTGPLHDCQGPSCPTWGQTNFRKFDITRRVSYSRSTPQERYRQLVLPSPASI